jgi:hypothetical protein
VRLPPILLLLVTLSAVADAPHVHGVAKLDAALEKGRLTLELHVPLEDLVGFERLPANDRERAAFEAMTAYFKAGKAFVPSAAAACRPGEAKVETHTRGKGHVELEAAFTFDCAEPGALKHVEAALLGQFRRLKRIDARLVTPKGQSAARLTPSKRSLGL